MCLVTPVRVWAVWLSLTDDVISDLYFKDTRLLTVVCALSTEKEVSLLSANALVTVITVPQSLRKYWRHTELHVPTPRLLLWRAFSERMQL